MGKGCKPMSSLKPERAEVNLAFAKLACVKIVWTLFTIKDLNPAMTTYCLATLQLLILSSASEKAVAALRLTPGMGQTRAGQWDKN